MNEIVSALSLTESEAEWIIQQISVYKIFQKGRESKEKEEEEGERSLPEYVFVDTDCIEKPIPAYVFADNRSMNNISVCDMQSCDNGVGVPERGPTYPISESTIRIPLPSSDDRSESKTIMRANTKRKAKDSQRRRSRSHSSTRRTKQRKCSKEIRKHRCRPVNSRKTKNGSKSIIEFLFPKLFVRRK